MWSGHHIVPQAKVCKFGSKNQWPIGPVWPEPVVWTSLSLSLPCLFTYIHIYIFVLGQVGWFGCGLALSRRAAAWLKQSVQSHSHPKPFPYTIYSHNTKSTHIFILIQQPPHTQPRFRFGYTVPACLPMCPMCVRKRRSNQITTKPHTEWTGKKAHHTKHSGELKRKNTKKKNTQKKNINTQRPQHTVARDTLPADSSAYDFLKFRLVAGQALSRLHVYFAPDSGMRHKRFLVILFILFFAFERKYFGFVSFETSISLSVIYLLLNYMDCAVNTSL